MLKGLKGYVIKPRREIKEFFTTVTIQQLAVGAINIFEPIYLYQQGVSVQGIVLFFIAVYVTYFFLMPFGGAFAKRFGYEHTLLIGTFFNIAYYLSLAVIPVAPVFLFVAPLMYCLQKTFWWPAYHADFARFSKQREVGREIGWLQSLYTAASAIGPVLGGLLVLYAHFSVLFIVGTVIMFASVLPLFSTPEKFIPQQLSWRQQMQFLFRRGNWRRLLGSLGFGEELIGMILWPIFIFTTLGSSFDVGVVVTIATVVTIAVTMIVGRLSDRPYKSRIIWASSLVQLFSWVVRPFVMTFGGVGAFASILASDTLSRTSKNALLVPWYGNVYRDAQRNHVMIEVVASELGLVLGKIIALAATLLLLQFTDSIPATFYLGIGFSVFYFFLR
jgi:MFS family permease